MKSNACLDKDKHLPCALTATSIRWTCRGRMFITTHNNAIDGLRKIIITPNPRNGLDVKSYKCFRLTLLVELERRK